MLAPPLSDPAPSAATSEQHPAEPGPVTGKAGPAKRRTGVIQRYTRPGKGQATIAPAAPEMTIPTASGEQGPTGLPGPARRVEQEPPPTYGGPVRTLAPVEPPEGTDGALRTSEAPGGAAQQGILLPAAPTGPSAGKTGRQATGDDRLEAQVLADIGQPTSSGLQPAHGSWERGTAKRGTAEPDPAGRERQVEQTSAPRGGPLGPVSGASGALAFGGLPAIGSGMPGGPEGHLGAASETFVAKEARRFRLRPGVPISRSPDGSYPTPPPPLEPRVGKGPAPLPQPGAPPPLVGPTRGNPALPLSPATPAKSVVEMGNTDAALTRPAPSPPTDAAPVGTTVARTRPPSPDEPAPTLGGLPVQRLVTVAGDARSPVHPAPPEDLVADAAASRPGQAPLPGSEPAGQPGQPAGPGPVTQPERAASATSAVAINPVPSLPPPSVQLALGLAPDGPGASPSAAGSPVPSSPAGLIAANQVQVSSAIPGATTSPGFSPPADPTAPAALTRGHAGAGLPSALPQGGGPTGPVPSPTATAAPLSADHGSLGGEGETAEPIPRSVPAAREAPPEPAGLLGDSPPELVLSRLGSAPPDYHPPPPQPQPLEILPSQLEREPARASTVPLAPAPGFFTKQALAAATPTSQPRGVGTAPLGLTARAAPAEPAVPTARLAGAGAWGALGPTGEPHTTGVSRLANIGAASAASHSLPVPSHPTQAFPGSSGAVPASPGGPRLLAAAVPLPAVPVPGGSQYVQRQGNQPVLEPSQPAPASSVPAPPSPPPAAPTPTSSPLSVGSGPSSAVAPSGPTRAALLTPVRLATSTSSAARFTTASATA